MSFSDMEAPFMAPAASPLKTRHLAANPYVSCAYWSPKQETVYADCRAGWADEERERVWSMFLEAPEPLGYDPATIPPWKDGPLGGVWSVLRLDPWRVLVQTSEDLAAGRWFDRVWRA